MLAYPLRDCSDMVLDLDLIRDLLLKVEANPEMNGKTEFIYQSPEDIGILGHSLEEIAYHASLLIEAGYLKGNLTCGYMMPSISRLTLRGHDFLGNIKDPSIWQKTKERLSGLPGAALSVVAGLALAEVKKYFGLH